PSGGLPPGWTNLDINSKPPGSSGFAGGVFAVQGGGEDSIDDGWVDGFQFAFTSLQGDGSIVGRPIAVLDNEWGAQAGIMLRDGLDPAAANIFIYFDQSGSATVCYRSEAGDSGGCEDWDATGLPPNWLKLTRQGNTFMAYVSLDGQNWSEVDSFNVSMSPTVYAGLAVSSQDSTFIAAGVFDNVSVASTTGATAGFTVSAQNNSLIASRGNTFFDQIVQTGPAGFT